MAAFVFAPLTVTAENETGDIFLPQGTVYENVFFAAGNNLNINGQMKDDVYLAGANVNVSGVIEGDLIAAGANVIIDAEVKGNLRVAGSTVSIKGNVGKNVTVAAANLTIDKNVQIGKNLIFGGANVTLEGKVAKNVYGGGANIILNNEIGGSAYLNVDTEGALILYPNTNIHGNLEYTAAKKVDLQQGARIQQQEIFKQLEKESPKDVPFKEFPFKSFFKAFFWLKWLVGLLGTLVVGMVLVSLFKDFTEKTESVFDKQVLWYFLIGLVVLIVTPIALLILGVTLIGLPLAMILGALYLVALYLAKIFVAIYLGEKIITVINKAKEVKLVWSMVVGVVVLYVLFLIPLVGLLAKLAAILWGLGVLAVVIKKQLNLGNNN